jgi:hypothetical protein
MSADVSEIPSCSAFELLAALIHTHYWRILTGDSCDLVRFPSRHRIYMTHDTCDIHATYMRTCNGDTAEIQGGGGGHQEKRS